MMTQPATNIQARISELIGSMESIATLPEVAVRINATINDPRSTAADLERIISHDPAMVARILKLVNSARYSAVLPIETVERAIVRIGFQAVQGLAIAAALGRLFNSAPLGGDFTARDLWVHSVAVATAAQEIAKKSCPLIAEQAFLAGLMHDIGLLAAAQSCPDAVREVCDRAQWDATAFVEIERQVIGVDHQQLGSALAARWDFPQLCAIVAAYHHEPSSAPAEWRQMIALVHAADTLCCQDGIGFDLTAAHQLAPIPEFDNVLPVKTVEWAREKLPDLVGDAVLMFSPVVD